MTASSVRDLSSGEKEDGIWTLTFGFYDIATTSGYFHLSTQLRIALIKHCSSAFKPVRACRIRSYSEDWTGQALERLLKGS